MDARLLVREAAGPPALGPRAALLQLADVPVLAVGQVPEGDRVRRVEVGRRDRPGLEQPLAGDPRVGGARRLQPMDEQVVGVDRQERQRPDQVVVDPPLVDRRHAGDRWPAVPMTAVDGHGLGVVDELHPAALPRARRGEVAAEVIRRQLVELRVDARAVVALAVVLADELPVRIDLVGDRVRDTEAGRSRTGRDAAAGRRASR